MDFSEDPSMKPPVGHDALLEAIYLLFFDKSNLNVKEGDEVW